ncbi:hypothetical protein BKA62DRAFT_827726 [Auriculariales sp. MPI-PUGE-AT-0066]|nr:hypothetical protein BKA62DRAFT_827726 [Auriculariales sp. MPI-PUGE-AT-0066]
MVRKCVDIGNNMESCFDAPDNSVNVVVYAVAIGVSVSALLVALAVCCVVRKRQRTRARARHEAIMQSHKWVADSVPSHQV